MNYLFSLIFICIISVVLTNVVDKNIAKLKQDKNGHVEVELFPGPHAIPAKELEMLVNDIMKNPKNIENCKARYGEEACKKIELETFFKMMKTMSHSVFKLVKPKA